MFATRAMAQEKCLRMGLEAQLEEKIVTPAEDPAKQFALTVEVEATRLAVPARDEVATNATLAMVLGGYICQTVLDVLDVAVRELRPALNAKARDKNIVVDKEPHIVKYAMEVESMGLKQ